MAERPQHALNERPLHAVNRRHLDELGGPFGIWQHASGSVPDEAFGSCTDDVARALTVDILQARVVGWAVVRNSARGSLRFLEDALDPATGRFRNFRRRDGTWLDETGSEDSHGRALLALGSAVAHAPDGDLVHAARRLFLRALPAMHTVTALRATASALLGCQGTLTAEPAGANHAMFEELAARLGNAFAALDPGDDWQWPEPILTYENALLPHALLVAGSRLGDDDLRVTGRRVLDWLIGVQTTADGTFSPIGSTGWWPRGGPRSRFDQQPIEATSMILAAEAALRETGHEAYRHVIESAYGWFLGANDVGVPVADPSTGGCHDGLTPRGVNLNEGAESTLMWLTALEHVRSMRTRPAASAVRATRSTLAPLGATS